MGVMFAAPPERMSRRGRQQVRVTRGILGLTKVSGAVRFHKS